MINYWCYPYICIKGISIPLAIVAIYAISISILVYGISHSWKHKQLQTLKWKGRFKYFLTFNILILSMLFAFSRADSNYNLYKKISDLFGVFRQIDVFLYAWVFLMLLVGFRYKNRYTYINTLIKYFITINYFELVNMVFCDYVPGQKGYLPFGVKVCIGISVAALNSIFKNFEFCRMEKKMHAIKNNDLFHPRRKQMDDILNKILTYTDDKQMSIFISDEWGGGKTFFARYLYNEIKKLKVQNIIWINLIDFNDEESFIKQVFKKIQIELNSNGFYTGWTSEFESYFETIINISSKDTITKSLLEKFQSNGMKNYVSLSESLEEFSQMLGDNKIIIIIDDVDRCTDNTITAALKLFSEIIMLPKSIMVFVGDYNQLLVKQGFGEGYFDKYFMYNYNLKTVPYKELFSYYQEKYEFNNLSLSIEINLYDEVQTIFQRIIQWYMSEEKHGIAEKDSLDKGQMRSVAVQESIELVKNMKDGICELDKKLSNPRRVQRIFNEVYEKLLSVSKGIKDGGLDSASILSKLEDIVLPATIFYSFTRNLCIDQFLDICGDDFVNFSDKVLDTVYEMSTQNDDSKTELKIYRLLIYYYFSTRFTNNKRRSEEFREFYVAVDMIDYLSK